jgi:hypothetical protein
MTTMQQETAHKLSIQQVRAVLKTQFERVFGVTFLTKAPADLGAKLKNSISRPLTGRV